jgi:hypothetical protein
LLFVLEKKPPNSKNILNLIQVALSHLSTSDFLNALSPI